jgi:hypothetical protein
MTNMKLNVTSKVFEAPPGEVEWKLEGHMVGPPSINRNMLLHKVWLSTDILIANKATSTTEDSSYPLDADIADMVDAANFGKSYVRAILPSEIQDFPTREELFEDLRDKAQSFLSGTGSHKTLSGYFFFRESSISTKFMNYDMLEDCVNSINSVARSYSDGFPSVDVISYPVNSSVYYTYPKRLTVGEQSVIGARAGDVIKFRNEGGSGDYTVSVAEGNSLVELLKGRIRVVQNVTGVVVIQVTDTNDGDSSVSTITINVEGV